MKPTLTLLTALLLAPLAALRSAESAPSVKAPARTSLTFKVTKVKQMPCNIGLSEIGVFAIGNLTP